MFNWLHDWVFTLPESYPEVTGGMRLGLISDVDPAKVWKDFHEQYMPWKAEGVFFTSI